MRERERERGGRGGESERIRSDLFFSSGLEVCGSLNSFSLLLALPERTRTHTSAKDFIPIIVRDTKSPFIVERFASEVISRALDHQCEPACNDAVNHLEGRRTSTLAAAACWLAIRKIGANVQPDDVSVCASISTGAMQQCARIIEAHWAAMFADQPGKNHLKILAEMKQKEAELAAKTGTPANSNNNAPDGEKK